MANSTPILQKITQNLSHIFSSSGAYTFLVGAGISMDAPSNLPSARQIARIILSLCANSVEVDNLMALKALRYELIVEKLQEILDKDLIFMDYFDLVKNPNVIHLMIAAMILRGNYIVTTNFDYLIEHALAHLLPASEINRIHPVITKADYLMHKNPEELIQSKLCPVFKIHGSKMNFTSRENTIDSLITTISDLGKDRESGEIFAIEAYKKPVMTQLMQDRVLIVMGYSGSDDFDIGPLLKELPNLRQLIWIDHVNTDETEFYKIENKGSLTDESQLSKIEHMLALISHDFQYDVYLIRGNTRNIVKTYMIPAFNLTDNTIFTRQIKQLKKILPDYPLFKEWAKDTYPDINQTSRFHLTCSLFTETHQFHSVIRVAQEAIKYINNHDPVDRENLPFFFNFLALAYKDLGDFSKAQEYNEKLLQHELETGNYDGISAAYSGLGFLHYAKGNYDEAVKFYQKVMDIAIEHNIPKKIGDYQNNIAMVYKEIGEYEKAQDLLEKSLKIAEQLGLLTDKALRYSNLAQIYKIGSKYDEALENYFLALKINQELGQVKSVGTRYSLIGEIYYVKQDYQKAEEFFNKALEIYMELSDRANINKSLNNLGLIFYQKKEFEKALDIFQKILEDAKRFGERKSIATRLNNIGSVYQSMKNYPKSIEYFQQALAINQELNHFDIITDLNNIAVSHQRMNDFQLAIDTYQKAEAAARRLNHEELLNTVLINLRDVYEMVGETHQENEEYLEAANWYLKSYEIEVERNHEANQSFYLHNIGYVLYHSNENERAMGYFQKALQIDIKLDDKKSQSDRLYYIGLIQEEIEIFEDAKKTFLRALGLTKILDLDADTALINKKLGDVSIKSNEIEEAKHYYEQALSQYQNIGNEDKISQVKELIASINK